MSEYLKLLAIAEQLDKEGFFKHADALTDVLIRKAYYYPGTNYPMQNRVVDDWKAIENEADEAERGRLNSPRFRIKDFVTDPESEDEEKEGSIFSLNGDEMSGITHIFDDGMNFSFRDDTSTSRWDFDKRQEGGRGYERFFPHQF
jgi:hypothetical protein